MQLNMNNILMSMIIFDRALIKLQTGEGLQCIHGDTFFVSISKRNYIDFMIATSNL